MKVSIKKIIPLFILVVALAATGFSCKGISEEQKTAVRPVALNYWTVFNDVAQLNNLAAEYKKIRPYVTVNIRQVRDDEFEKLFVNALADDVPPDIVSIHTRVLRNYQNRLSEMPSTISVSNIRVKGEYFKETIITTENLTMPSTNYIKSNYVGTVYNDAVIGDKIYGLPLAIDTLAVYYNKDLLDKAGVPEPPGTWEEFMQAVKATTKFDQKGNIIQSGVALGAGKNIDNAFDVLSLFMMQSGVTMAKGSYVTFAIGLDKPAEGHAALRALNFYTDFAQPTKEVYSWNEKMGNALEEFARGKSAFYFGFAYDYPRIRTKAPQMNLDVVQVPQLNEDTPTNVANYWIESVVKKSKHRDEAWDFVRFISLPSNIKKYTKATRRPSPLRSQINEQKEDVILAPFASQALNSENWYRGRDYSSAKQAFNDLLHSYLQPYEDTKKLKHNADLIIYAAKVVQQTM